MSTNTEKECQHFQKSDLNRSLKLIQLKKKKFSKTRINQMGLGCSRKKKRGYKAEHAVVKQSKRFILSEKYWDTTIVKLEVEF